jgi:hypothetical protein
MLAQLGQLAVMPLRVPLWAAQLATGTKSFERNPVIGSHWLNEHGLHTARVRGGAPRCAAAASPVSSAPRTAPPSRATAL